MNSAWFEAYLTENTPDIDWHDNDENIACHLLSDIASANGGAIFEDVELPPKALEQFAVQRADEAIRRRLNQYAQSIREHIAYFVYSEAVDEKENAFTVLHRWHPKLDLNSASIAELEALPAIGEALAARIVAHRNQHGAFQSVAQLPAVKGIDEGITSQIADRVFVMPERFRAQYCSAELMALMADPTLASYTVLLIAGGGFDFGVHQLASPLERLLREFSAIRDELRQEEFVAYRHVSMTRSSKVEELGALAQQGLALENSKIDGKNATAGLLFDESYFTVIKELLSKATQSIKIIMFYMRYDDRGEETLSDQLVKEVLSAKKRGVNVQVILDRDRKGDVFKSRLINNNAFKAFKEVGIEVLFDERGRATHTKLVVVDDAHVILGSHNWTTGSLHAYDDTSIYVASKSLAKDYSNDFVGRFEELKQATV